MTNRASSQATSYAPSCWTPSASSFRSLRAASAASSRSVGRADPAPERSKGSRMGELGRDIRTTAQHVYYTQDASTLYTPASPRGLDLAARTPHPAPPLSEPGRRGLLPSQSWAPGLRARLSFFQLTCAPSSPTLINSARASAPSIRRPRRPQRPARDPEPPPLAVWAQPPPHPAPQSPLFLALPGAQVLGDRGGGEG